MSLSNSGDDSYNDSNAPIVIDISNIDFLPSMKIIKQFLHFIFR